MKINNLRFQTQFRNVLRNESLFTFEFNIANMLVEIYEYVHV